MNLSRILAPYYFRKSGHETYLKFLEEVEANQWKSPEAIAALQWEKFQRILQHAACKVPYYRDLFRAREIDVSSIRTREDLKILPLLSKRDLQTRKNDLIAEGVDRSRLQRKQTSGSTGIPTEILIDSDRGMHSWAYNTRHNRWAGLDWGCLVASLWGLPKPTDIPERIGWFEIKRIRIKCTLTGQTREFYLNPYHHNDKEMEAYVQRLAAFKPDILLGYANSLYFLARFIKRKGIRAFQPKGIITGGEMLFPESRQLLEEVFQSRVYNRYGSRECDIMASECERGSMHFNDDNLLLEIITEPGQSSGRVVVTDLNNYSMPLIRYDFEDLAFRSENGCACGRGLSVLGGLEGRTSEMFRTVEGRSISGLWFNPLLEKFPEIHKYQIQQTDLEHLVILIVPDRSAQSMGFQSLQDEIHSVFGAGMHTDIRIVEDIPAEGSGKYRFMVSKFQQ